MNQKFYKVVEADGKIHYTKTRYLTPVNFERNKYVFKNSEGKVVEPTDLELELYNEVQTGGLRIKNGWLTFLGLLGIINLIGIIIILSNLSSRLRF